MGPTFCGVGMEWGGGWGGFGYGWWSGCGRGVGRWLGCWWRCEFGRGVVVGLGKGKSGERGVLMVDAWAGGRVLWGVSVEVLMVVDVVGVGVRSQMARYSQIC